MDRLRPFAPEPRLSIQHLMIWSACVAVYMSAYHTMRADREGYDPEGVQTVFFGIWAILGGTYLAGALLMVVRWIRRQSFPRSGGEMIWIFGAVAVIQSLLFTLLDAKLEDGLDYYSYRSVRALTGIFVWTPLYIYAIRRYRKHWRAYFLVTFLVGVFAYMYEVASYSILGPYMTRALVNTCLLALVAWIDARRSAFRLPWPHWTGIAVAFSSSVLAAISYLVHYFMESGQ